VADSVALAVTLEVALHRSLILSEQVRGSRWSQSHCGSCSHEVEDDLQFRGYEGYTTTYYQGIPPHYTTTTTTSCVSTFEVAGCTNAVPL
jgi:hypothetical protein